MAANYRAIRCCYHRGFYYTAGDPYNPGADEINGNSIPEHFVKERDFSDDLVEAAETEDRNRQVFIKPSKVGDPPPPVV
jgi:hypothetical protein